MAKKGGGGGGGGGGKKKANQKQVQKIVQDKTFGMKNKKKSAKVQKYVQTVHKQVEAQTVGKSRGGSAVSSMERARREEELALLAAPTVVGRKRVEHGVDPKSVLCEFFKRGACKRGNKCKFSHDLKVERKAEKIDLFTDRREEEDEDLIDDWDQEKLETVVKRKHGAEGGLSNKTKIVCKHFLDAVESKKYGWFWECPNGGKACQYVHALPPGYVFKSQKKEEVEERPISEIVEEQRAALTQHTPLTLELFVAWKAKKCKAREEEERAARGKDAKANKPRPPTGRELFASRAELFVDDEAAAGASEMRVYEQVDENAAFANRITATGTSITVQSLLSKQQADAAAAAATKAQAEAAAAAAAADAQEAAAAADASLFGGDDLDDLDDLE